MTNPYFSNGTGLSAFLRKKQGGKPGAQIFFLATNGYGNSTYFIRLCFPLRMRGMSAVNYIVQLFSVRVCTLVRQNISAVIDCLRSLDNNILLIII